MQVRLAIILYCCLVTPFIFCSSKLNFLAKADTEEAKIVEIDAFDSESVTDDADIVVKKVTKSVGSKTNDSSVKDSSGADGAQEYNPEKDIVQWLHAYSEALATIQKKAFRKVDFKKFIKDSLKLAISNVDAHSAFFDNDEFKSTIETTTGEFSGIGVSIIGKAIDDDALMIIDVVQGGPAHKVGLKRGDKIIGINKEKIRGLSTDEVINKLKGKVGSVVNLKIIRSKKPLSFSVKRDLIKDQTSVCYYFKQQRVYYLSLKHFAETAAKQMNELLTKANKGRCKGLILDLRSNPGGTLDSAIDMAGLFLPKGSLVCSTKDRQGKTMAEYFTKTDPILKSDVPIFILINNFTASASEILAGCLRYHSQKMYESGGKDSKFTVFLVGTTTFGKGSVQELIPIKNGCALKLTTMLYFLPGVKSIQAQGVDPDFEVKSKILAEEDMKWIKELFGQENSLKNHITQKEVQENLGLKNEKPAKSELDKKSELEKSKSEKLQDKDKDVEVDNEESNSEDVEKVEDDKDWEKKQLKALGDDNQVQTCVNMINVLHMVKKYKKDKRFTRQRAYTILKKNYIVDSQVEIEKVQ